MIGSNLRFSTKPQPLICKYNSFACWTLKGVFMPEGQVNNFVPIRVVGQIDLLCFFGVPACRAILHLGTRQSDDATKFKILWFGGAWALGSHSNQARSRYTQVTSSSLEFGRWRSRAFSEFAISLEFGYLKRKATWDVWDLCGSNAKWSAIWRFHPASHV